MSTTPKNLVSKLCDIMKAVERIHKHGHNDFHDYDYVREADVADAIRTELTSHNVFLSSSLVTSKHEMLLNKKGEPWLLTTVTMRYTFRDGDSSEVIEFDMAGQGSDLQDKGIYKAITGCTKYALMKTFLIPTGDDPEDDKSGKQLMTTDMNGNMKPVPEKKESKKPESIQNVAQEKVFIGTIDFNTTKPSAKSQGGAKYLVIHGSKENELYYVWDTTFFPMAEANLGRTLTLTVKTDTKGRKSIVGGLEPIDEPILEEE